MVKKEKKKHIKADDKSNDENDEDYNVEGDEESEKDKEESELETCQRCSRTYQIRGHFVKHLEGCNPAQIEGLAPRYTLKQKAKMKTEDGRSSNESLIKRK